MVIIDTETTKFAGMASTWLFIDNFHQNPCKCCFRWREFEKFSSFKTFYSLMVANVSFLSHGFVRCKPWGIIEIIYLVLGDDCLSHDVTGDLADLSPKKARNRVLERSILWQTLASHIPDEVSCNKISSNDGRFEVLRSKGPEGSSKGQTGPRKEHHDV